MSNSEEHGSSKGLSIIKGKVKKIKVKNELVNKVPVIGWNKTISNNNYEKRYNKLKSMISNKNFIMCILFQLFQITTKKS